jgi:predicted PurR-regulated permease PerM
VEKKITFDFSLKNVFIIFLTLFLAWLLFYLRDIIVLFFIAFILGTALEPAVDYFQKKKVPRWTTALVFYLLLGLGLYFLVRLIVPPMSAEVQSLAEQRDELAGFLNGLVENLPANTREALTSYIDQLPSRVGELTSAGIISNVLGVFSGLLGVVTVFVVTFYLLLERAAVEKTILAYWPEKTRSKAMRVFKKMSVKMSLWVRGQLILSGVVGILTFIGLTILGVEYALTLALIAAVTELLPIIGPFIGAAPAILIALSASPTLALWVMLLYFGIQQFESQVLVPMVMKKAVGLSPIIIIFSLLVGARLLGFIGIIIAVPVASAISVLLDYMKDKKEGV